MKKIIAILTLLVLTLSISAEEQKKFNPEQFIREQEAFITKEARLTPQEANAFFPVFREMQEKQRELFKKMKECSHKNPQNDKEATQLITTMDNLDFQIKKIQSQYHNKFCKIIPATKAHQCIKAEEKFKQHVMDKLAVRRNEMKRKK